MIGDLKKQLVHSLVNEFNETLSSSSLLNQMDQEYLDKFHNQLKCYEDLIKWIQQVGTFNWKQKTFFSNVYKERWLMCNTVGSLDGGWR